MKPITINPAEVIKLGEAMRKVVTRGDYWEAQYMNDPMGPQGNQARLNNGCACDSDCAQCGALAKSWDAMRLALEAVDDSKMSNGELGGGYYTLSGGTQRKMRAALRLAERVKARR